MRVPGLSPTSPLLTNAPTRPIPTLRALFENRFVKEGSLLLLGYIVYMSLRPVFPEDLEAVARTNALKVIDIERSLGIYWEPALQSRLLSEASWIVTFFNWAYSLGFLPIIVPGALALLCLRYDSFVYFRRVFLISYVVTWVLWLTLPVTPPRLMIEEGFMDSIEVMGPAFYNSKESIAYYNQHSAMPSMHFGWTLLFSIMLLKTGSRALRLFGAIFPIVAFAAIVITANHFFLDAVVGGGIIGVAFAIYHLAHRPPKPRASSTRSSTVLAQSDIISS